VRPLRDKRLERKRRNNFFLKLLISYLIALKARILEALHVCIAIIDVQLTVLHKLINFKTRKYVFEICYAGGIAPRYISLEKGFQKLDPIFSTRIDASRCAVSKYPSFGSILSIVSEISSKMLQYFPFSKH